MRTETYLEAQKLMKRKTYLESVIELLTVAVKAELCAVEFPSYEFHEEGSCFGLANVCTTQANKRNDVQFLKRLNLDENTKNLLVKSLQDEIFKIDLEFTALRD